MAKDSPSLSCALCCCAFRSTAQPLTAMMARIQVKMKHTRATVCKKKIISLGRARVNSCTHPAQKGESVIVRMPHSSIGNLLITQEEQDSAASKTKGCQPLGRWSGRHHRIGRRRNPKEKVGQESEKREAGETVAPECVKGYLEHVVLLVSRHGDPEL